MTIKADEISKIIREQIGSFAVAVDVAEVGTVVSLGAAPVFAAIIEFPLIREKVARMAAAIYATETMAYRTSGLGPRGAVALSPGCGRGAPVHSRYHASARRTWRGHLRSQRRQTAVE